MIRLLLPLTAVAVIIGASAFEPAEARTRHTSVHRTTSHRAGYRAPRVRDGGSSAVDALNEQSLRTARGQ